MQRQNSNTESSDGFLGAVAEWGRDGSQRSDGRIRTSRMIGTTFGDPFPEPLGPPGPPPMGPPPNPPSSTSPTNPRASRAFVQTIRRKASGPDNLTPPPTLPPPSSALPALPHQKAESISSISSVRSRMTSSPPPQPSPRSSSLPAPADAVLVETAAGPSSAPMSAASRSVTGPNSKNSSKSSRTPSRHLLQTALDLAQKAVEMDKDNDVHGALEAYREAVSRLKSVMERVGVEPNKEDGKRRKNGKSEEEGRTLRGIHDAYVARIQLLSSYETDDQPPSPSSPSSPPFGNAGHPHPSTSTSTLVPQSGTLSSSPKQDGGASGDRTPRPSLDDTIHAFGVVSLNDVDNPDRQSNLDTVPEGLSSPFRNGRVSTDEPISANTEMMRNGVTVGGPSISTPIKKSLAQRPGSRDSDIGSTGSPSSLRSRSGRRRIPRASVGLENELDLQISEEEQEQMEMLEKTPQLGGDSSSTMGSVDMTLLSPNRSSDFDTDRPLPPIPGAKPFIHARQASLGKNASYLVSPTTADGTISQRRLRTGDGNSISSSTTSYEESDMARASTIDGLPNPSSSPSASFPTRSATNTSSSGGGGLSSLFPSRLRTRSQPGRPSIDEIPPLPTPTIRHKGSFGSSRQASLAGTSRISSNAGQQTNSSTLAPPVSISSHSNASTPRSLALPLSAAGSLMSPLPESQPSEITARPFHLLRLIQQSMDSNSSGSYLTGKIHVTPAVWKPTAWPKSSAGGKPLGPPKIVAQDIKVKVMEALIVHLGIMQQAGTALVHGPREYRYGANNTASQDPSMTTAAKMIAEEFCSSLDGLEEEMNTSHKLLVKNGVAVGAWKGKKTGNAMSWGSKITKTMDKMTSNKAIESPDRYVDLLSSFCAHLQTINAHLSCVTGPCTTAYQSLPQKPYTDIETRILRAADFVGVVVVPFILDDFKQFFLRYLKGGVRYMEV